MPKDNNEEQKLSRWEMRKLAVTAEREIDLKTAVQEKISPEVLQAEEDEHEAQLVANREAAEAIDIAEINEKSDMSVFWKEGVPELLKKKAMMTLWRSNPIFANVDGLNDYDEDFANPDLIMKTFESAYEAGRGYMDHIKNEAKKAGLMADDEEQEEVEIVEADEAVEEVPVEAVEEENLQIAIDETDPPDEGEEFELTEEVYPEPAVPKISLRRRFELEAEV